MPKVNSVDYRDARRAMRWMNPHVWFKFRQAQANTARWMRKYGHCRQRRRRVMKWVRAMNHWNKPMMACMEKGRP